MKAAAKKAIQQPLTTVTLVAAISLGILEARKASSLSSKNQLLQQQEGALTDQIEQLRRERNDAAGKLATLRNDDEALDRNTRELLRLRGEVGKLKRELAEATGTKAHSTLANQPNDALEQRKRLIQAKSMDAYLYVWAFLDYAKQHKRQLPTDWTQVDSYLTNNPNGPPTGTNVFEMLYHGPLSLDDLGTNWSRAILIREFLAWPTIDGEWGKVYGFANGSSEIHYEPDGDFTTWEKQFVIPNALGAAR
jgi:cell division protein FtsB